MPLVTSCLASATENDASEAPGEVRIAVNGWVGYQASAAVLTYLLENELGYRTEHVQLDEDASWRGLDGGSVDVIVENWGHQEQMELYGPGGTGGAADGGPNGNEGIIGWYIPKYLVEEHPEIGTVKGLKKNTDLFASPQSEDKGVFLGSDPSFVTQDQGMINNFGLDLKIVYAGSEEEQISEIRERYEQEEPVLFYFYQPQWLFEDFDLVQVEFPEYVEGCEIDPEDIGCGYPEYELNKIFRKGFTEKGGDAYRFLDKWQWTNEDQNTVARMIADEGMDPEDAAAEWVADNSDVWQDWLP
ncbi:glycine betaine ABC transporter substrate-binding protein [Allosalinactinospora lopnorensis]|uniref:glycine betaine ABC transporter substrate-binding protein n=1 Tax=Allosalinactinospora lopnorensis TaxID=1352348 RepID=UPI000623CA13|nr:glycine betaine ABC transporter substrate-binding protein [Allosalinactinospora lopnorensis]